MKKKIFVVVFVLLTSIFINASVIKINSTDKLNNYIINCHADYSIIVEFPKQAIIKKIEFTNGEKSDWSIDYDLNLLWFQPQSYKSNDGGIKVFTDLYNDIFIKFRSVEEPDKLIHTIVLKEKVFTKKTKSSDPPDFKKSPVAISLSENIKSSEKHKQPKGKNNINRKKTEVDFNKIKNPIKEKLKLHLEKQFSLSGGTMSFEQSGMFVEGEGILAGKDDKGLFFQLAGKLTVNKTLKDYGISLGLGYEPSKLGMFLFFDSLSHKFGDQIKSTIHIQARPSFRYRLSDKFHLSAFFAIPVNSDMFTGIDLPGNPEFGYYNKSLVHGGLDFSLFLKNFFIGIRGIFAEGSAYSIKLEGLYRLFSNIFLSVNYACSDTGKTEYLGGITNSSRISAGIVLNGCLKGNPGQKRIIFPPDYPMVISIAREKKESDKKSSPSILLAADPLSGPVPLNVSYTATPSGFKGNVTMTWHFNTTYSTKNNTNTPSFEYDNPGTYQAWVEGTDESGNYAKSNTVTITVYDPDSTELFTISASVKSGEGIISPKGDTVVPNEGSQKYNITPADGWFIKNVYCDGKSVGAVSEYEFKNVCENHKIEAEFSETAPSTHTITVTVKDNRYGTVSPGTTEVEDGTDATFNFTPEDNNKQTVRYWVNGKVYNEPGSTGFTFKNVTSDQTLEVEFDWIYYDVAVTLTLEEGGTGSVDPGVGTFTYKKGSDLTFNFIPGEYSEVRKVYVNGNNKGRIETFKIYDLGQDERIDVYMKKKVVPVEILNVGGCGVTVTSSTGESGVNKEYDVYMGENITFYFEPQDTGSKDYYISIDGKPGGFMPLSHTFYNVLEAHQIRIKCVEAGDPPPF